MRCFLRRASRAGGPLCGTQRARIRREGRDSGPMRYLVTARVKPGSISPRSGHRQRHVRASSIAGDGISTTCPGAALPDGTVKWVGTCFCATTLDEERPSSEAYLDLLNVRTRTHGQVPPRERHRYWACSIRDSTERLEARLATQGERLRKSEELTGPSTSSRRNTRPISSPNSGFDRGPEILIGSLDPPPSRRKNGCASRARNDLKPLVMSARLACDEQLPLEVERLACRS